MYPMLKAYVFKSEFDKERVKLPQIRGILDRKKVDAMNKAAAELSLANDFIFGEVMRQPENVKPLLEAVLEKKIAEITYIEKQ